MKCEDLYKFMGNYYMKKYEYMACKGCYFSDKEYCLDLLGSGANCLAPPSVYVEVDKIIYKKNSSDINSFVVSNVRYKLKNLIIC
ncbi:MAG: hypothetical protein ACRCXT_09855 [Paraclostridium sp.]